MLAYSLFACSFGVLIWGIFIVLRGFKEPEQAAPSQVSRVIAPADREAPVLHFPAERMNDQLDKREEELIRLQVQMVDVSAKLKAKEEALARSTLHLNALTDENKVLKERNDSQQSALKELEKNVEQLKNSLSLKQARENSKLESLEDQAVRLQDENRALSASLKRMEEVKSENEKLAQALNEGKTSLVHLQEELKEVKRHFEEQTTTLKKALALAEDALKEERQQRAQALKDIEMVKEESAPTLKRMEAEVTRFLKENAQLLHEAEKARAKANEVEERERLIEYELTKSRAQTLGLERLCEDFKEQIEGLSKRS